MKKADVRHLRVILTLLSRRRFSVMRLRSSLLIVRVTLKLVICGLMIGRRRCVRVIRIGLKLFLTCGP